jgi:PIN domain nuclease of toxin-antitoxin system
MRLLLDTHAFLWFIDDNPRLSPGAKTLLESDAELLLSMASLWEIAIKVSLGRLTLAQPFNSFLPEQLAKNSVAVLPISLAHLGAVAALPFHHRDPFDRLLIAQAAVERTPLVSADATFDAYAVQRIW